MPSWLGWDCCKYATDLWIFQELIFEIKPDFIIECGTGQGGVTLFMAHVCDLIGHGHVISLDVVARENDIPRHPRISYIHGASSVSQHSIDLVYKLVGEDKSVIVDLDSDHSESHVRAEMEAYASLVNPSGSYLIVEDTDTPGPDVAVKGFLETHPEFKIDDALDRKYEVTHNPGGYLRKL